MVLNYYPSGQQHLGLTKAQISYKRLSKIIPFAGARAGFFYPKLSLENVDSCRLSPYTYTQSAINNWFDEELRTAGLEFILFSPGRARYCAFSWEWHAAAFKANEIPWGRC